MPGFDPSVPPPRQWLPPEKVELLGVSTESDNLKMALAGSSKRSVKEAYTRAKQWLRRSGRGHQVGGSSQPDLLDQGEESCATTTAGTNCHLSTRQLEDCNT